LNKENAPGMPVGGGAADGSVAEVKKETAPGMPGKGAGEEPCFPAVTRGRWPPTRVRGRWTWRVRGRINVGGPDGYKGRVCERRVKKNVFGINALQIAIFRYFIVLPPYPLAKTSDGWVLSEG
jgi:hypothetical protein